MRKYKGKHNDDLFSLIDNSSELEENNSFNTFQSPGALTPEEVLGQIESTHTDNEPTGALDYQTGKNVLALLQDTCRDTGKTVIVITHNAALTAMADRVVRVRNGAVASVEVNPSPVPVEEIEW